MSSNRRRNRTDRVDVTRPVPVEETDSRPVIVGGDSDPNASLVETEDEGGQAAAAAPAGRRRPTLRYLNTEDGLWFNHAPCGASQPDALSSGAGFADVAATRTAAPGRRDGAPPLPAGTSP